VISVFLYSGTRIKELVLKIKRFEAEQPCMNQLSSRLHPKACGLFLSAGAIMVRSSSMAAENSPFPADLLQA
jgi:hypothetical protein